MLVLSAEVEELEVGGAAIGPGGSMVVVMEEVKRASWEVRRDGGVSKWRCEEEGVGQHCGDCQVNERCSVVAEEIARIGYIKEGGAEEVGSGVGREEGGEESSLETSDGGRRMSASWDVEGDEEFPELVMHAGGEMCFEIVAK